MLNQNENLSTAGIETKASRRARLKNPRGLGLVVLLAVAAFLRFFDLGLKPPHFDEGINGHFVTTIWRDGFYNYDPTNFHGPLYFYLCHLAEILLGRSIDSFRAMNSVLAMFVVFSVYRFRVFTGKAATVAAWMICVSPAFTFYGRYAIHETLFILGQLLFVYGRFTWMNRPTRAAVWWMAIGTVVLVSTKETFFIFFGTWLIAEVMIRFLERHESPRPSSNSTEHLSPAERHDLWIGIGWISGLSLFALAALYTGFFEKPQGLRDFFKAFAFWSKTGVGAVSGHEKSFVYWMELFWRYEWTMLVGFAVSVYASICLRMEDRKQRILSLVGFGTWLAYSLIPYKTPWLILNFWPLLFFAQPIFDGRRFKFAWRFLLAVLLVVSLIKTWHLNFINPADSAEPYVYVQTTGDYKIVMNVLRKKLERNPEARNMVIVVSVQDPWPLPFDLSLYPKMRYARLDDIAKDASILGKAGLVLVDGSALVGLRNVFPKRFAKMKFQLRDSYGSGWALFDAELFEGVLPGDVEYEEAAVEEVTK